MFNFFLKQRIIMAIIAISLLFGSHCGGDADKTEIRQDVLEGLITDVNARTLLDLESIEVTDDAGKSLVFHAGGMRFTDFTPGHARVHMLQGEGVTVTYREAKDGLLYIIEIRDRIP